MWNLKAQKRKPYNHNTRANSTTRDSPQNQNHTIYSPNNHYNSCVRQISLISLCLTTFPFDRTRSNSEHKVNSINRAKLRDQYEIYHVTFLAMKSEPTLHKIHSNTRSGQDFIVQVLNLSVNPIFCYSFSE